MQAPLTRWENEQSFDSARECEHELYASYERARKKFLKAQNSVATSRRAQVELQISIKRFDQYRGALCIANDDPRLKEK
jgi:hypothetical protein